DRRNGAPAGAHPAGRAPAAAPPSRHRPQPRLRRGGHRVPRGPPRPRLPRRPAARGRRRGMSRETWAIETRGLVKVFGANRAVDGVDLAVPTGCVYSVLGPNGAGKTTMIRMIATLLRPDGGTARVLGDDVVAEAALVRARLALTGQFASLDEDLTGLENLILLARLRGYRGRAARKRATDLLEAFDLGAAAKREVKTYSGGMRRRLDIAGSLVVRPDLLILDEPTTGLDPRSRGQVWESVRALVGVGATVLLTTQYLEEADQLADRIAVVDHGRVIVEGTSARLKALVGAGSLRVRVAASADRPEVARLLADMLGAAPVLEP